MVQQIIVLVIIASAVFYIGYSIYKSLKAPRNSGCSGCDGCALEDKAACHPVSKNHSTGIKSKY
jgi:hypothetical protein